MKVRVIGFGYWGKKLARVLHSLDMLSSVRDANAERQAEADRNYPDRSGEFNAVAIATPIPMHHALALEYLNAGYHVWVEKPACLSTEQAVALRRAADNAKVNLFVDHTYLYSPECQSLFRRVSLPFRYHSVRVNHGIVQEDTTVIWDLAPHDFSILHGLTRMMPETLRATGDKFAANVSLAYRDGTQAHCYLSWVSPAKVRRIEINTARADYVYDDLTRSIELFVCGKRVHTFTADDEPLVNAAKAFLEGKNSNELWPVTAMLEAANESLAQNGALIKF